MKKFLAIAAAILVCAVSFAQETNIDKNGNYVGGPYETNAFGDNVFWGVGIGVNSMWQWTNTTGLLPFLTSPGVPAIEGYVGKWFTPGLGIRAGYYGLSQGTATLNPFSWNPFEYGQHIFAVDVLWNFSNSVYGYSDTRKWNWAPYFRAGLDIWGDKGIFKGINNEWVLGFGSMITYKWNDKMNLVIDNPFVVAKAVEMTPTKASVGSANLWEKLTSRFAFPFSVMVGVQWNVGKTGWTRTATTAAAAAAALAAANAKAAAAAKAAEQKTEEAKKEVETAKEEAKQIAEEAVKAAGVNVDELFNEPVVVYFEIGQSKLSKTEKAHAEYAIKNIISRGNNVKFTLNGSADTGTGSKARNKQLSKERAQTVYNLVDALGVSRDNITVVEWDGKERFATPELNRAVIIEKQ
jgi:outer membrane protein OmpA-like peptidoglycan-associated protein